MKVKMGTLKENSAGVTKKEQFLHSIQKASKQRHFNHATVYRRTTKMQRVCRYMAQRVSEMCTTSRNSRLGFPRVICFNTHRHTQTHNTLFLKTHLRSSVICCNTNVQVSRKETKKMMLPRRRSDFLC